jgi:hypothetical protein
MSKQEKEPPDIIEKVRELKSIHDHIPILPELEILGALLDVYDDEYQPYIPIEPEAEKRDADENTPEECDRLIAAEVLLPRGDILLPATVVSHKQDAMGNPIGSSHINQCLTHGFRMSDLGTITLKNLQQTQQQKISTPN